MTRTYRLGKKFREGRIYNPYYFYHDPPKVRRSLNKSFRLFNKIYLKKYKEVQYKNPAKSRGYDYW